MDMKKILQAFDGAATKPVEGASDMKKFMSIIRENANPYTPVEENVITSFEEGSVGGDANAFLIAADNINDEVMGQIDKIKINADPQLLKNLMAKFNEFMSAYHAVGKEILQPDMFDKLPGNATSTDNTDESVDESMSVNEDGDRYATILAKKMFATNPNFSTKGRADELINAAWTVAVQDLGKKRAQWEFNYDEDFLSDFVSDYGYLQRSEQGVEEGWGAERQASDLAAANQQRAAEYKEVIARHKDDPEFLDYLRMFLINNWGGLKAEKGAEEWIAKGKPLPDWFVKMKQENPEKIDSIFDRLGAGVKSESLDSGLSFKDYFNLQEAKKGLQ